MAKSLFVCQSCSAQFPTWQGQCDQCGEWGSLVEEVAPQKAAARSGKQAPSLTKQQLAKKIISFPEVEPLKGSKTRISTGIGELDRVLGGGIVPGAVMLVGGEPGIGKSTLLTQVVIELLLGSVSGDQTMLYVAGEESPSQISLRIKRYAENEHTKTSTKKLSKSLERLSFATTSDVDEVLSIIESTKPALVVVDSIQTLTSSNLTGAPGSVGQLRECAENLTSAVKRLGIPTFLVGHVTKDGTIAGPKVLEHIVDSVLELSGERTGQLRVLRAIKNRFGATDEVGVFKTVDSGLQEVSNPSDFFLEQSEAGVAGSATVCVMEGTRPLLAEVQGLVVSSQLAMPRRVGRGVEVARMQVLAAVLQKHCKLPLGSTDIFLSAVGGFKIREPGADLGLAVAIASSLKNTALPKKTVFIGEVGLLGEIRSVSYLDRRIKEAKRLGFKNIISKQNHQSLKQLLNKLGLL